MSEGPQHVWPPYQQKPEGEEPDKAHAHEVLGLTLEEAADEHKVRERRNELWKEHHPDTNGGRGEEAFKTVGAAAQEILDRLHARAAGKGQIEDGRVAPAALIEDLREGGREVTVIGRREVAVAGQTEGAGEVMVPGSGSREVTVATNRELVRPGEEIEVSVEDGDSPSEPREVIDGDFEVVRDEEPAHDPHVAEPHTPHVHTHAHGHGAGWFGNLRGIWNVLWTWVSGGISKIKNMGSGGGGHKKEEKSSAPAHH